MLGPFDWYSAIVIGIAAAVVAIVALIFWLRPPQPEPWRRSRSGPTRFARRVQTSWPENVSANAMASSSILNCR